MTDTRTDLPSREAIIERMVAGMKSHGNVTPDTLHGEAYGALSALTLLDLAAEMQRRGAEVRIIQSPNGTTVLAFAPQQEDTAE